MPEQQSPFSPPHEIQLVTNIFLDESGAPFQERRVFRIEDGKLDDTGKTSQERIQRK